MTFGLAENPGDCGRNIDLDEILCIAPVGYPGHP